MKIVDGKRIAEVGDCVYCKGVYAQIKKIEYQDHFGEEGFDMEFTDTSGRYRSWKQRYDGGTLINKGEVPKEVIENVRKYLAANLPRYYLIDVKRKSNHEDDHYLYMVIAKNLDGEYAVWTCWNDRIKSLNWGHYGIATLKDCVAVCREYFHKVV